ncbi:MAG TPA: hypothetical protein VFB58_11035 [Chloroflexota bacterium]|nr:hypothetical protein [Chloroflexota bacterium]
MNGHDSITDLLARRRELTPDDEAVLRDHLAGCADCRRTAADFAAQDDVLRLLGDVIPPDTIRRSVLRAAGRRRVRPLVWPVVVVAAIVAVLGGYGIVAGGGLPWVPPDRHLGQGYSGPGGGIFIPATPTAGDMSRDDAIAAAVHHFFGPQARTVPANVSMATFLGIYTDSLFKPRLVWIVRFQGPGIVIVGDGPPRSPVDTLRCPPAVGHEEMVFFDAHSGAFVEDTSGLVPQGLPMTVTPAPAPTPCPTPAPTDIAPFSLALAPNGDIVEVGEGIRFLDYQIQERTPDGMLLRHWSADPTSRLQQQVTGIGVDGRGDVYVLGNNQHLLKFTAGGRLIWSTSVPTSYGSLTNVVVARDGTAYIPEGTPHPGIRVIAPDGRLRAVLPGWYEHVALAGSVLVASRAGTVTVIAPATGSTIHRWHVEPGEGYIQGVAGAAGGTVWLLEQRFSRSAFLGYEIAHFTAAGQLLTRWHLPTVTGTAEVQGSEPKDLAVDRTGRIYVADYGRAQIMVFSAGGRLLRRW